MRLDEKIDLDAIKKAVRDGREDELLWYLDGCVRDPDSALTNDIVLAVLRGFSEINPEEWNLAHLAKMKIFQEFSDRLALKDIDLVSIVLNAVMFNCLAICNDFYNGLLTIEKARERLQFVRMVSYLHETFSDNANFEVLLGSIAAVCHSETPCAPRSKMWCEAFSAIHRVIVTCYLQIKSFSPQTYDALVLLLNRLHRSASSEPEYQQVEFEKFLADFGFYISENPENQAKFFQGLKSDLIGLECLKNCIPNDTQIVSRIEEREKYAFEKLKSYFQAIPETKWLNTRQIYEIVILVLDLNKGKDELCGDRHFDDLKFRLNRFQDKDRFRWMGEAGIMRLCHLFNQYNQLSYEIFCKVFCNKLELGGNLSHFWRQLNRKFFKRRNANENKAFASRNSIYRAAFLGSPHLRPAGGPDSQAQQLVDLMLGGIPADTILVVLCLDNFLQILNQDLLKIIFSPRVKHLDEYSEKIFQYGVYLLLILHLEHNNPNRINPKLVARFFDDECYKWRSTLYVVIKHASVGVISSFFSVQEAVEINIQLERLTLLSQIGWHISYARLTEEGWDLEESPCHEINFLSSLDVHVLKKIVALSNSDKRKGWEYYLIELPIMINLIKKNYPLSAIRHYMAAHLKLTKECNDSDKAGDFINDAEKDFSRRFVSIRNVKHAIMFLSIMCKKEMVNFPFEVIVKIASYLMPMRAALPKEWALNLRARELFLMDVRSKERKGACYAAIRDHYPMEGTPTDYEMKIRALISQGLFTEENIRKLPLAKSELVSLNDCKPIYKGP